MALWSGSAPRSSPTSSRIAKSLRTSQVAPSLIGVAYFSRPYPGISFSIGDCFAASSHLISAQTLRSDNFNTFYIDRKARLLALIERVMGKQALSQAEANEPEEEEDELTEAA